MSKFSSFLKKMERGLKAYLEAFLDKYAPLPIPEIPDLPSTPDLPDTPIPPGSLDDTSHRATFLINRGERAMNILSMTCPQADFERIVGTLLKNGDDTVYLFFSDWGDGNWKPVSFYQNRQISGPVSEDAVVHFTARLRYIRARGLKIVAWLFCDDSAPISREHLSVQTAYISEVHRRFDAYIFSYVPVLEANEHMSLERTKALHKHTRAITTKDIGIHLTPGQTSWANTLRHEGLADTIYYQYGFNKNASQIEKETRSAMSRTKGMRFIACEYHLTGNSTAAQLLGDAAMHGGAFGTGNGRTPAPHPTEPPPPTEPEPSDPNPTPFDLKDVRWLHHNVSGWAQTATLQNVLVQGGNIHLPYSHAKIWKSVGGLNANPWIFVQRNGRWYAATWEWMRGGQTSKASRAVQGDHIKKAELRDFKPRSGESYGFMISGLCRDSKRNVHERTQVVMYRWP